MYGSKVTNGPAPAEMTAAAGMLLPASTLGATAVALLALATRPYDCCRRVNEAMIARELTVTCSAGAPGPPIGGDTPAALLIVDIDRLPPETPGGCGDSIPASATPGSGRYSASEPSSAPPSAL